jgi:hypothetical protein
MWIGPGLQQDWHFRTFPRGRWFEVLFGFKESVGAVYSHLGVRTYRDRVLLTSDVNGRTYNAGKFSVRSVSSFTTLPAVGGGVVNIIRGRGAAGPNAHLVDALQAQSIDDFDGATFLAASNFNCLELANRSQTPAMGVTHYAFAPTQGPSVALAAGPALVYRNYFARRTGGDIGQIRLLEKCPVLDRFVRNGAPCLTDADLRRLRSHNWDDADQFSIGVHENCEVTTTRDHSGKLMLAPPGRIVHHVYAAALPFLTNVPMTEQSLEIGKKLLIAEYRATVLAAWELSQKYRRRKGSNKLFLTFLGGGVFHNPSHIICEAICNCKDLIVKSGLKVSLVCYRSDEFADRIPHLRGLIEETGGRIIDSEWQPFRFNMMNWVSWVKRLGLASGQH